MYRARIELTFDAAHRLLGYDGKCASAHGHTFRAEVIIATRELDNLGLTLDFRDLKRHLRAWVDEHWDHAFLLNDRDTQLVSALGSVSECKLYLFRDTNPSVEAVAHELFVEARRQFGTVIEKVRVWETPTQYAEYEPDAIEDTPSAGPLTGRRVST